MSAFFQPGARFSRMNRKELAVVRREGQQPIIVLAGGAPELLARFDRLQPQPAGDGPVRLALRDGQTSIRAKAAALDRRQVRQSQRRIPRDHDAGHEVISPRNCRRRLPKVLLLERALHRAGRRQQLPNLVGSPCHGHDVGQRDTLDPPRLEVQELVLQHSDLIGTQSHRQNCPVVIGSPDMSC